MNISTIRTRLFHEHERLVDFIEEHIPHMKERSILAITSKIAALAEGRTTSFKSKKDKEHIIRSESEIAIKTKHTWLTVKDGIVLASAGVDESNANGRLILLPKDSFAVASRIRAALKKHYSIKNLGIILTDSRVLPLRAGVVGVALGYAGFRGIKDYRKKLDIYKRPFSMTQVDVADALATSAVYEMGEGDEQQPLALIENANVEFCERVRRDELRIPLAEDMYRPLFSRMKRFL